MGDDLYNFDSSEDLDSLIDLLRAELSGDFFFGAGFCTAEDADVVIELTGRLTERYELRMMADNRTGADSDLRESVTLLETAVTRSVPEAPWLGPMTWRAGIICQQPGEDPPDPGARDPPIGFMNDSLGMAEPGDEAWREVASALGQALYDRYGEPAPGSAPDPGDLDRAIDLLTAAVPAVPGFPGPDREDELWCRFALGTALMDRPHAGSADAAADLDAAIGTLEAALDLSPVDDPGRGLLFCQLAEAYWRWLDGDVSCHTRVDRMTACAEQAWALLDHRDEDRPRMGFYLAAGIHERLLRPGAPFDGPAVDRAIEVLTAIEPEFSADFAQRLLLNSTLANFLIARGQATSTAVDLAAAEPRLLETAATLPIRDPDWADVALTVAADLTVLAHLGMDVDHLDQAINFCAQAISLPEADPARAALRRGTLGVLLIQRAGFTARPGDLDEGVSHLLASHTMAPAEDPYRVAAAVNLGGALLVRYLERGQAEDVDAARYYLTAADSLSGPVADAVRSVMADVDQVLAANRALLALTDGLRGDADAADDAVGRLRAVLAAFPESHPHHGRIRSDLAPALCLRAGPSGSQPQDLPEAARQLSAASAAMGPAHLMQPLALLRTAGMLAAAAVAGGDPGPLRRALQDLAGAVDRPAPRFGHRSRFAATLGTAATGLYQRSRDPGDITAAAAWLEQARDQLSDQPFHPQYANVMISLARAYRARGDLTAACRTGLEALLGRNRDLLLQSGTARALSFAQVAAAEAAEVALWCLDDRRPASAVSGLELGHGLILHAATTVAEVPDLLISAGRPEL